MKKFCIIDSGKEEVSFINFTRWWKFLFVLSNHLLNFLLDSCGLYYKRITIVIDAPSVVSKWRSKLEHHLLAIVIDDAS